MKQAEYTCCCSVQCGVASSRGGRFRSQACGRFDRRREEYWARRRRQMRCSSPSLLPTAHPLIRLCSLTLLRRQQRRGGRVQRELPEAGSMASQGAAGAAQGEQGAWGVQAGRRTASSGPHTPDTRRRRRCRRRPRERCLQDRACQPHRARQASGTGDGQRQSRHVCGKWVLSGLCCGCWCDHRRHVSPPLK